MVAFIAGVVVGGVVFYFKDAIKAKFAEAVAAVKAKFTK